MKQFLIKDTKGVLREFAKKAEALEVKDDFEVQIAYDRVYVCLKPESLRHVNHVLCMRRRVLHFIFDTDGSCCNSTDKNLFSFLEFLAGLKALLDETELLYLPREEGGS